MENIRLPEELLPKNLKKPAAFIVEKAPDLPDFDVHTGDLVLVEQESEFAEGDLSAFLNDKHDLFLYRISNRHIAGFSRHIGKIVMVIRYYQESPL